MKGPQRAPQPVLLIAALMSNAHDTINATLNRLSSFWGPVACEGDSVPFDQTSYYAPEMGEGLFRRYVAFEQLIAPDALVMAKQTAWAIEQEFSAAQNRQVNIDPGYLDLGKVILASFKPAPHKLYLGERVWADMALHFRNGQFDALPWSFPDFKDDRYVAFFSQARACYKKALRR